MKRQLPRFVVFAIISIGFLSCVDNAKKKTTNNHEKIVNAFQNENTFEPGENWVLAWSDEFEADTINLNNWNFQVVEAGHFNDEWQRYTNSNKNAYIENGCLVIKAIHESSQHGKDHYTSARLHTANKQTFKYGKITAKVKLPFGHGIWPAFWMLGSNIDENGGNTPWPQSGEIDIFELYGSKNDSVVEANLHYADKTNTYAMMGAVSYKLKDSKFADAFHIFELDWDTNKITWLVDGVQYASMSISAKEMSEFHKEFFILLNVAVGGKWAGRPDASSVFPQYMYVDWVRVYKKRETK